MNFNDFTKIISESIEEMKGKGVTVVTNQVTKNNGIMLSGISIVETGKNIFPTIYLNDYYREYIEGEELKSIIDRIIYLYEKHKIDKAINLDFFTHYAKVKKQIVYKLINYKKNKKLLSEIPHVKYLDLAIVFYCMIQNESIGSGSILIYNTHCETWNINTKDIYKLAKENTEKLLPAEIKSMEEVMREMFLDSLREEFSESVKKTVEMDLEVDFTGEWLEDIVEQMLQGLREDSRTIPMYVLKNNSKINGATCILYPDVLKEFADIVETDLYLLPSSIHEMILIPVYQEEKKEKLKSMVEEVNQTQVEAEEVLSDNVYFYSREKDEIRKL